MIDHPVDLRDFKAIYVPYEDTKPKTKMIEIKSPLVHVREKAKSSISSFLRTQS